MTLVIKKNASLIHYMNKYFTYSLEISPDSYSEQRSRIGGREELLPQKNFRLSAIIFIIFCEIFIV